MRRTLPALVLGATAVALAVTAAVVRPTAAQDESPTASGGATKLVERVMTAVGHGQIDDAVGLMEGLKARGAQKDDVRSALLAARDGQLGPWRGYELSTVVRFSGRLQTLDVLGYYDLQPVLYRFELYQPAADGVWTVLDLRVEGDLDKATEVLREDAAGAGFGRGGRATR